MINPEVCKRTDSVEDIYNNHKIDDVIEASKEMIDNLDDITNYIAKLNGNGELLDKSINPTPVELQKYNLADTAFRLASEEAMQKGKKISKFDPEIYEFLPQACTTLISDYTENALEKVALEEEKRTRMKEVYESSGLSQKILKASEEAYQDHLNKLKDSKSTL